MEHSQTFKYNYTIYDWNGIIEITYNDIPIKINVNNYSYTIDIKKSKKFEDTLNIFIYNKSILFIFVSGADCLYNRRSL